MNLVLMGLKHCGKSTLGQALAKRSGRAFYDTDSVLEEIYRHRTGAGYGCREIFRLHGEAYWDGLELAAVEELAKRIAASQSEAVIALGGRTAMNEQARPIVRELGTTVLLEVDREDLYRRIVAGGLPPFLNPADPESSFAQLCRERLEVYRPLADLTVDITGLNPDEALEKLEAELKSLEPGEN